MTPFILTDKSRLQEIYDLRVYAWESTIKDGSINRVNFPDGWSEEIDEEATHFIIENDANEIIASARISLHNSLEELPYPKAFEGFQFPDERPFAFYSRLVVSPDYRAYFLYKKLDTIRVQFLKENSIHFALATVKERRVKSMLELGFEVLGPTKLDFTGISIEYVLFLSLNH